MDGGLSPVRSPVTVLMVALIGYETLRFAELRHQVRRETAPDH